MPAAVLRRSRGRRPVPVPLSAVLLAVLPWSAASSQTDPEVPVTGAVSGVVVDALGEPLPWPVAVLGGGRYGAQGDGNGRFVLRDIPPGVYGLRVIHVAADTTGARLVTVRAGQVTDVRVVMDARVFELPAYDVEGENAELALNVDNPGRFQQVRLDDMDHRPIDSMEDALSDLTGVTWEDDGLHVQGGRSGETKLNVDGLPASDPLGGAAQGTMTVALGSVSGLALQAGGMDAESGNALSGIIDMQTKEGGEIYSGSVSFHTDDFGAPDKTYFNHDRAAVGFGGPVPGLGRWLKFHVSGEAQFEDTYLFNGDRHDARVVKLVGTEVASLRDRQNNELRGQAKLTWNVGNARKLSAEYLVSRADNGWYHHTFSRTGYWSQEREHWWFEPIDSTYTFYDGPAHVSEIRRRGDQYKLVYTHPVGDRSFFKARAGLFRSRYKEAVGDKRPEEYVSFTGDRSERDPVNLFYAVTGDYPVWEVRDSRQYTFRLDYQNTIGEPEDRRSSAHELKAGMTVDYYDVFKDARRFPGEQEPEGTALNRYRQRTTGGSFYVRDRLRYENSLVFTAGLRADFFDPGLDAVRVGNERHRDLGLPTAGVSWVDRVQMQVSPRLGVSYPITDVSVLHFTYGRFFQLPNLEYLYDFQGTDDARGQQVGNPFLRPETQISYQFGVRRRLTDNVMIDASIFFKDIFGLIGTERLEAVGADEIDDFAPITYVNQDYGSVRGLELSVRKQFRNYWQAGLSYTLSRATGSSSDVNQGLAVIQDGQDREPIREVPLAWDRTHLLNAHLYFSDPGVWGLNFDLSVTSGAPATPIRLGQRNILAEQIGTLRLPGSVRLGFRANKQYELYGQEFRLFLEGRNLLDRKNPVTHYPRLFPDPDAEYYREYFTEYGELGGAYNLSDTIGLSEDVLVPLDDPRVWGPPRSFRAGLQYEW